MWNRKRSLILSIIVCFIFLALLSLGLFLGPWFVKMLLCEYRGFNEVGFALQKLLIIFKACFYPCAVFAYITLYSLIRLLLNIKNQEIFIIKNVRYLRRISWCCFIVSGITLVGGFFYFSFIFISIAAAFMGLMLRIVKNVMQNAVEINDENQLTI